jgi:hypothetical protein
MIHVENVFENEICEILARAIGLKEHPILGPSEGHLTEAQS